MLVGGSVNAYVLSGKTSESLESTKLVLQPAAVQPKPDAPVVRSLPTRLVIPRINVDSNVEYTGVTASGNMAVPSDFAKTGWYKLGTLPGNKGSAVMTGHVNGPKGQPGVFARLPELQVGDTIETVDTNGLKTVFKVRDTKRYGKDEQPAEVFNSTEGTHLNLITCVGEWNAVQRQYSDRLVVFADLLQ